MNMGVFPKRKQHNEPLVSVKDLAQEFGVTVQALSAFMQHHNGPKHEIVSSRGTYFKPTEVRRWWKTIKELK